MTLGHEVKVFWHSRNKSAKHAGIQLARAGLQSGPARADISATMRTLGYRTNAVLAVAAAAGVIAALGRPWYAGAPVPIEEAPGIRTLQGPTDGAFQGATRWFARAAASPAGTRSGSGGPCSPRSQD